MCYNTLRLIYYFFHMENQELRFQLLLILRYTPFSWPTKSFSYAALVMKLAFHLLSLNNTWHITRKDRIENSSILIRIITIYWQASSEVLNVFGSPWIRGTGTCLSNIIFRQKVMKIVFLVFFEFKATDPLKFCFRSSVTSRTKAHSRGLKTHGIVLWTCVEEHGGRAWAIFSIFWLNQSDWWPIISLRLHKSSFYYKSKHFILTIWEFEHFVAY